MCDEVINGLSWFRISYGPKHDHNVGQVAYAALGISSAGDLPNSVNYLHGRIGIFEDGKRQTNVLKNRANIPNEDAVKIINAAHDQCEGNDSGEISAAPPIVLADWLRTLFAEDVAIQYARKLNTAAHLGDDGASDVQASQE